MDDEGHPDLPAGWIEAGERPGVRGGECGHLDDALRPDHDVGQVEAVVRERREEGGVERTRPGVALPALAGRREQVDTVGSERRDEPVDVAAVLGDRVALPQAPDAPVDGGIGGPGEAFADRRPVGRPLSARWRR